MPLPDDLIKRVLECLGGEAFNRLVLSVEKTRKGERLRFWQEELLCRITDEAGVRIDTPKKFIEAFEGVSPVDIPILPLTKEEFFQEPNRVWYSTRRAQVLPAWFLEAWESVPAFRENLTYELTRSVSKNGDFFIASDLLEYLPTVLVRQQVVMLYEEIRDQSSRLEFEWRGEFEKAFCEHAGVLPPRQDMWYRPSE